MKRFFQERREARSQKRLLKALSEIDDPQAVDIEGLNITPEKLEALLQAPDVTSAQKKFILALANRNLIRNSLAPVTRGVKVPIEPLPSADKLKSKLRKLQPEELEKTGNTFERNVTEGNHQVFVVGHNAPGPNIRVSDDIKEILPDYLADYEKDGGYGEGPIVIDKLAPGYKRAKDIFESDAFKTLMRKWPLGYSSGNYFFQPRADKKVYWENQIQSKSRQSPNNVAFITSMIDVYLPSKKDQKQNVDKAQAAIKSGKIVRAVDKNIDAYKCVRITIYNDNGLLDFDKRMSTLEFLVVLGKSNGANKGLSEDREYLYDRYLDALITNPGFFLEKLKKVIPEAFELTNGKNYYPRGNMPNRLTMHLNVPELDSIGIPDEVEFEKME